MAEGIGLLNQRTILLYHGFESLFLRANKKKRLLFFVHFLSIQATKTNFEERRKLYLCYAIFYAFKIFDFNKAQ